MLTDRAAWILQWGISRDELRAAVGALARLYPPDFCRKQLRRSWDALLVAELFHQGSIFGVLPLIAVGLDLVTVEPWHDTELLAQLRDVEKFEAAAFELRVWAAIRRAGIAVIRQPADNVGQKADFKIWMGRGLYFLEVKLLENSDHDRRASRLNRKILFALMSGTTDGVGLSARASPDVLRLLPREWTNIEEAIARAFSSAARRCSKSGAASFAVEGYGWIDVIPGAPFSAAADYITLKGEERDCIRALRSLRKAHRQLGAGEHRIVIVDVGDGETAVRLLDKIHASPGVPELMIVCGHVGAIDGEDFATFSHPKGWVPDDFAERLRAALATPRLRSPYARKVLVGTR